ncbi:condensation domain-containing protein, partial [Nostoc sp.]
EQTFNEIVRRHETLRTTFIVSDGQPLQAITPRLTIPLSVLDLQQLADHEQEVKAKCIITAEIEHPFDLSSGPLLRVILLVLSETEHILLLNMHHIICDDWSMGVLIRELGTLYAAFAQNQPSPLLEVPLQYADFAHWQREWLQGEV